MYKNLMEGLKFCNFKMWESISLMSENKETKTIIKLNFNYFCIIIDHR